MENIAIFDHEAGVLDAIRLLREAGAEPDDIRVIVNNREGAPILSSEGDVRIEELYELQITRSEEADKSTYYPAPQTAALPLGVSATGPGPVGVVLAGGFEGDVPRSAELLREMGIPKAAASRCAKAIENGEYVVVTDTEAGINAEGLLRRAGAGSLIGWDDE